MSKVKDLFRKITAVTLFFTIATLPFIVLAQSDQSERDRNIQKTLESMDADLDSISAASQNSLRDVQAAKSVPLTNTGVSRESSPQAPVQKNILQQQTAREPEASSTPSYSGQSSREEKMEITLRNVAIELSLEYFVNMGSQSFNVIDEATGANISKVIFPLRGGMPVVKGEVRFLPRVSVGGKYANSELKERTCSDEDWGFWGWHNAVWKYIDYQDVHQASKSMVELYDINLYYNLFNFSNGAQGQRKLFPVTEQPEQNFGLDGASLDVFAGYQYYKSRCRMLDPVYGVERFVDGTWWHDISGFPADYGLDSFYKIEYHGPRIGLRATGSKGKVTTGLRFALASLETKAHGWWNLREYSYWQTGSNGYGMEAGFDTTYAFTPSFSAGLGFNSFGYFQQKMKESGDEAGVTYNDLNIVRHADSWNYGPTFILKYIW